MEKDFVAKLEKGFKFPEEYTWKDFFDVFTDKIRGECQRIPCSKFLPLLKDREFITFHHFPIEEEPKATSFLNALKKGREKLLEEQKSFGFLVYVYTLQEGGPEIKHCVQMLLEPANCSKNDLVEGMYFFDRQIQKTMRLKDFPVDRLKRIQVVSIRENVKNLHQDCGKHRCR